MPRPQPDSTPTLFPKIAMLNLDNPISCCRSEPYKPPIVVGLLDSFDQSSIVGGANMAGWVRDPVFGPSALAASPHGKEMIIFGAIRNRCRGPDRSFAPQPLELLSIADLSTTLFS